MNSNYDHDNLLEIRKRGQVSHIPRGDYGDTSTALVRPVDVQKITQDAIGANAAMVNQMLRQFAPTIDAQASNRRPPVSGISSPDELSARNQRFRWVLITFVILSSVGTAGIVSIAVVTGSLTPALGVSFWIALTAIFAATATWHVQRTEQALSPEAIELERVRGEFDIATQDGETKRILIEAFAESIKLDAQTKRDNAEAQRLANLSLLERSKPVQAPQRAGRVFYDEIDDYADETPYSAPESPTMATYDTELPVTPLQPVMQPDKDLVNMLAEIDRIYAYCEERDSDIIKIGLEWAAAGKDWSQDAKEKAARVLAYFEDFTGSPLIYRPSENGAKYRLNRQQWSNKRIVKAMIAREWNN